MDRMTCLQGNEWWIGHLACELQKINLFLNYPDIETYDDEND